MTSTYYVGIRIFFFFDFPRLFFFSIFFLLATGLRLFRAFDVDSISLNILFLKRVESLKNHSAAAAASKRKVSSRSTTHASSHFHSSTTVFQQRDRSRPRPNGTSSVISKNRQRARMGRSGEDDPSNLIFFFSSPLSLTFWQFKFLIRSDFQVV